jgi:hypothetical protein
LDLFAEPEDPPDNNSHHNEILDIEEKSGGAAIVLVDRPISINRLGAARATTDSEIKQPLLEDHDNAAAPHCTVKAYRIIICSALGKHNQKLSVLDTLEVPQKIFL